MKKLFTFALLALLSVGANAQDKKTWDFTQGFSDETIADLDADANWTVTRNDDGSFKQANEAKKLSGPFKANGNVIKELAGLELGTAGLSKNNNVIIFPNKFRINRNNMEIIFPSLKNGQTVTIVGRSANSSAENRGIKAGYPDYMTLIEGPEDCLIRASLGEVTLKWKIETSGEEAVPVKFTMITGGVDFSLFMIDEGDVIPVSKVAYLCSGDASADVAFKALQARENTEVTTIDVSTTTVTSEQLQGYDVTVIGASVPADNAAVAVVKEAMPFTPMLNLNANLYPVWGYGTAVALTDPVGIVKNAKHKLLTGVETQTEDGETMFDLLNAEATSTVTGVKLGEYFKGDDVPVVEAVDPGVEPAVVAHTHNINHNGYVFVTYSEDASDAIGQIIANGVTVLANSKAEVTKAATPLISQEYKDMNTNVTIAAGRAQPKTRFFYTTDGTDPTAESTEYKEAVNLTQPCTFKAVAIAEGYLLSDVAELAIEIKEQPKTPVITYVEEEGKTTITLTCESEDAEIWYNFETEATTDTLKSTKYVEPIVITAPQNVNAFAVAGRMVWSEVASDRVLVKNPRVVIDVAAHYSAPQWTADNNPDGKAVANGKGMFSWGASAASMYTGEGTSTTTTDEEGNEITETVYTDEDLREIEVVNEPGENPAWVLKSRGTCLIWQSLTASTSNFGSNDGYNPMFSTDVDPLFPVTKNAIQFYKFQEKETPNASIESLNAYAAPFDVVVLANMQGGPLLVQISAEGTEWTTIGEIAKTEYSRMWNKSTVSYDGEGSFYIRLTQDVISSGAKVFDIYVANEGEKSKVQKDAWVNEYNEKATGITDMKPATRGTQAIFNLNGVRQQRLQRGLNIVVMGDGAVRKVVVK